MQGRDFKNILTKLRYVIIPKFNLESDPEGVREHHRHLPYLPVYLFIACFVIFI